MSVATGPENFAATTQELGPGTIFVLAEEFLGGTWADIGEILLVTSVFAGMIAFHNMWARYSFALGRERVLPAGLGQTSAKTGAPVVGSILQSVIGLVVIAYYASSQAVRGSGPCGARLIPEWYQDSPSRYRALRRWWP